MANVFEMNHPLVSNYLSIIRDKNTDNGDFRNGINNIASLLFYEASKKIETYKKDIETPVANCTKDVIDETKICIIPILRAGLAMSEPIMKIVPNAKCGMIGLYRDSETKNPVEYLVKLPSDIASKKIFVVDPMLATGGSASYAIKLLKDKGAKDITLLSIIGAPEGIKVVNDNHPDVDIYISAIDDSLNENKYIIPGLGDAGDRIFGTDK